MNDVREVQAQDPWWKARTTEYRALWRMSAAFARRDLQLRFVQTKLGWIWALAQPIALVASLTLVLGRVFGLADQGIQQFGLNLAAALPGWIWFQYTVSQGGPSLIANQTLVSKTAFPRAALPNAKALVGLADFVVGSAVVGAALTLFGAIHPYALLRLPIIATYTALAGLGWAYLIAALSVRSRDLLAALPVLMQALFFLSPIVLPSANFAASGWELLYWLNPAVAMADGFRWAWMGWDVWQPFHAISAASGILGFVAGGLALRWRSRRLNEFL